MPINIINRSKLQEEVSWEKENEKMRKKLERNSMNSIKYKYA